MSFWDNVKKFAQPYADDEYDDYDDEDEYLDDYDDEPAEPVRRAPARRTPPAPAPVDDEDDDDDDGFGFTPSTPAVAATSAVSTSSGFNGRVLNTSGPKQEVVLFRPQSFNDTSKAADSLRSNKAVVLNLENVDKAMARRVVDFLSGTVYAVDGSVKKVAQSAYLFCPRNMDVVGDLEALQAEVESYV
ncbi:MAG: cell division protein SepF [Oscillospiraceae bacterium]|nr:cell division protein SepF [Oscillospiraceae bacterium]